MTARLYRDERAIATLEFAVVAPVMLAIFAASTGLGIAFWEQVTLQTASEQAARCDAVGSVNCETTSAGCDSPSPIICYVETISSSLGVTSVTAGEVAVASVTMGGVPFVSVTINHVYSLVGYNLTLTANALYPQNGNSWATSPVSSEP